MAVYDDQKTDSEVNQLRYITGIGPDEEQAMDRNARSDGGGDSGGTNSPFQSKKATSANDLAKAESNAPFSNTGDVNPSFLNRTGKFLKSKKGRNTLIGGGIAGFGIGGVMTFMSLFSGPLEFIHIAQIMQGAHFSNQENASDDRLGKMYRWMKQGNTVGETRLSYLESKYNKKMLAELKDIGLEPHFDARTGYIKDIGIDTTDKKSPYYNKSDEEVKTALQEKWGLSEDAFSGKDGSFSVKVNKWSEQRRAIQGMTKELGYSKVPSSIRTRVLGKYAGVDFHPMHMLDKKVNQSLVDLYDNWKNTREEKIKNGVKPTTIDKTGASIEDKDGKTIPIEGGGSESPEASKYKDTLNSVKESGGLKITGGVAAAVGIACAMKSVNDNIGAVRYVQVILPIMRTGMDAMIVGQQIMSGNDVDPQEMEFLAKLFDNLNEDGSVHDSWDQSASIRQLNGGSGGIPLDQGTKDMIANVKPGWLSWVDEGAMAVVLKGACTGIGGAITGIVSIGVSVISGGFASTFAQGLISYVAAPKIMDFLTNLLAGDAIDGLAKGALWGNYVDYGALFGANAAAVHTAAVPLTTAQLTQLNADSYQQQQADFAQKSFFARAFDPTDYRSLTGRLIDSQGGGSPTRTIASLFGGITKIPNLIASSMNTNIFGQKVRAATTYNYGVSTFGFSQEDLDNPAVGNPVVNGEQAAKILDRNGQNGTPDYISRAEDCFMVQLSKTADDDGVARWGAVPSSGASTLYDGTYPTSKCIDKGNADWLRIRFLIFDTSTAEGYACYNGDQTSCDHVGFNQIGSDTTGDASSGGAPSGNAKELAQQILDSKNYIPSGLAGVQQDLELTAQGKPGTAGAPIDPRILQIVVVLLQKHKVSVNAFESNGTWHMVGSLHYRGLAVDLGTIDGVVAYKNITDVWPEISTVAKDATFLQGQCSGVKPTPAGMHRENHDTCNHEHIDFR